MCEKWEKSRVAAQGNKTETTKNNLFSSYLKYATLPIVEGYLYQDHLVIRDCPFCGGAHFHGGKGYKIGDIATRVPHCHPNKCNNMAIDVVGELTAREYQGAQNKKPNPKRTRTPRKINLPIKEVGK